MFALAFSALPAGRLLPGLRYVPQCPSPAPLWIVNYFYPPCCGLGAALPCTLYTVQHWLGASFYLHAILGFAGISPVPPPNRNTCGKRNESLTLWYNHEVSVQLSCRLPQRKWDRWEVGPDEGTGATSSARVPRKESGLNPSGYWGATIKALSRIEHDILAQDTEACLNPASLTGSFKGGHFSLWTK